MADFMLATLLFWVVGFGLMFGAEGNSWLTWGDFCIGVNNSWRSAFFVFQAMFVGASATIDPCIGKFYKDGNPQTIQPSNHTLAIAGALILFSAGSSSTADQP